MGLRSLATRVGRSPFLGAIGWILGVAWDGFLLVKPSGLSSAAHHLSVRRPYRCRRRSGPVRVDRRSIDRCGLVEGFCRRPLSARGGLGCYTQGNARAYGSRHFSSPINSETRVKNVRLQVFSCASPNGPVRPVWRSGCGVGRTGFRVGAYRRFGHPSGPSRP
jgi:hypothetical protein